ncbi:MAG TPA: hypothetical protein VFE27_09340 [Acidobacteriaceae bacterium]|nr:hypothetical protein [Acidobacteriaceae bacterium]
MAGVLALTLLMNAAVAQAPNGAIAYGPYNAVFLDAGTGLSKPLTAGDVLLDPGAQWSIYGWVRVAKPMVGNTVTHSNAPWQAHVAEPVSPASDGPGEPGEWVRRAGWRLQAAPKVTVTPETVSSTSYDAGGWLDAIVPGTVLTTMVARGLYPDHGYGLNNLAIPESLNKQDYWYRKEFSTPAIKDRQNLTLTFEGINYAASVWLKGKHLGEIHGADPVHVQMNLPGLHAAIVNNTTQPIAGATLEVHAVRGDGTTVFEHQETVSAAPQAVTPSYLVDVGLPSAKDVVFIERELKDTQGALLSRNFYWYAADSEIYRGMNSLPQVAVTATAVAQTNSGADAHVSVSLELAGSSRNVSRPYSATAQYLLRADQPEPTSNRRRKPLRCHESPSRPVRSLYGWRY